MFGSFKIMIYLCTCVFHSIRFKVNKGLQRRPTFFAPTPTPHYIIKKNSPTTSQWQRNRNLKSYNSQYRNKIPSIIYKDLEAHHHDGHNNLL